MKRYLLVFALVLAALAGRAQAIEMFTNFHNGENVGFPPMQVPYSVYGGIGHGGWNPHAQGMPLKTYPPVPAMSPTGQLPGRSFDYYGAAPIRSFATTDNAYQSQLVSDRRHGRWQRGAANLDAKESGNEASDPTLQSKNSATEINSSSSGSSRKTGPSGIAAPSQPKAITPATPTILHAESPDSEMFSHVPMIENSLLSPTGGDANQKQPVNSANDSQTLQDWPRADALFPHTDHLPGDAG